MLGAWLVLGALGCGAPKGNSVVPAAGPRPVESVRALDSPLTARERVVANALEQTRVTRLYDPAYTVLPYPMGDVPRDRGVCTDVVVRAFRAAGIDLQREV